MKPLAAGERLLQYKGEITSWRKAVRRHQREGVEGHTFLFGLSDGSVIDGSRGGNSARWLNHACAPNCETIEDEGRIFIHTSGLSRPVKNCLLNICSPRTVPWMKTSGRSTHVAAPRRTVVTRCWPMQREQRGGRASWQHHDPENCRASEAGE
jgi:hypothetical protein